MHEVLRLHNVAIFGKVRVISDYYLSLAVILHYVLSTEIFTFYFRRSTFALRRKIVRA